MEDALLFVRGNFTVVCPNFDACSFPELIINCSQVTLIIVLRYLLQRRTLDVHVQQLKALLPDGFPPSKLLKILVALADELKVTRSGEGSCVTVKSLKALLL